MENSAKTLVELHVYLYVHINTTAQALLLWAQSYYNQV